MIVQLAANIRIAAEDGLNYELQRLVIGQSGKSAGIERWDGLGCYPSLQQAAMGALRKAPHMSDEAKVDVARLIAALDRCASRIVQACARAAPLEPRQPVTVQADELPDDLFEIDE
jgi:hypothetical protein